MNNLYYVAAIFRVDSMRGFVAEPAWDEVFGREVPSSISQEEFERMNENPEEYMPFGSAGTLHREIWVNPDESELDSYTVSVFGDLKGGSSASAVRRWFNSCCSKLFIRQAVCTVRDENAGVDETFTWEDDAK